MLIVESNILVKLTVISLELEEAGDFLAHDNKGRRAAAGFGVGAFHPVQGLYDVFLSGSLSVKEHVHTLIWDAVKWVHICCLHF